MMDKFIADLIDIQTGAKPPARSTIDRLESTWFTVYDRRASLELTEQVLGIFLDIDKRLTSGIWPQPVQ